MRKFIVCLLLGVLLEIIPPLLPAQQNQNTQQSDSEIEALKKRVSELEKQLQSVENVEKMDLQAKLAEANAKLVNAEFGKFERGLKDSNDERMRNWVIFFVAIVSTAGVAFWFVVKSLIADRVEKDLNGFKEAVKAQDVIKNQLEVLEKEYAASVLERTLTFSFTDEHSYSEKVKALREETLLQVFGDEIYQMELRYKAAAVLASRKSPLLVYPLLEFLNSFVDSDSTIDLKTKNILRGLVMNVLGGMYIQEAYQGLKGFLNHLLTENPKHKDLFLTWTVFALGWVSVELDVKDSVPLLKKAIPYLNLKNLQQEYDNLGNLAENFDKLNEPAGIKEILNYVASKSSGMEDVENRCLELLQRHDPKFVKEQRAGETTDNSNT